MENVDKSQPVSISVLHDLLGIFKSVDMSNDPYTMGYLNGYLIALLKFYHPDIVDWIINSINETLKSEHPPKVLP